LIMSKAANKTSEKVNKKHLLNPITLSFVIGLIFMIFKIRIPSLALKPLLGIGHTTIYISMIYVGAVLAQAKLKPLIQNLRSYVLSFNKLIFAPLILAFILILFKNFGLHISNTALICAVLQTAMPCMIIISVLAEDLGLNAKQAVENILVSSVLSIFTLPLIYWLISIFL
ncbi:MAG: AEC family transporter, partial [Bacteroidales bacterium]|nr:AEC family transporter [Bacteroidales bacterium]